VKQKPARASIPKSVLLCTDFGIQLGENQTHMGYSVGGILVQVVYDELKKWVEGPEMRWLPDLNAHKAFWKLASKFHAHFTAGPFNYSIYNQTRKCEIA